MLFAIWHHLCDLKNVGIAHAEACTFTQSNTPPWVFFAFFKLQKWYQIAQSVSVDRSLEQISVKRQFHYLGTIR